MLIPMLLVGLATPRFVEGIGLERSLATYNASVAEQPLSSANYQRAAGALTFIASADGDGLIERAEMITQAANGRAMQLREARAFTVEGLRRAPANPRGWTLLCEIDFSIVPSEASRCMDTAFFIAPFDWYVARKRALLAAYLWPGLDLDVREAAARRVRLMWESDRWPDHRVKEALYDVYRAPNGEAILFAAFKDDREQLRALNRWLVRQEMEDGAR
jgi:hypothetical protein